MSDLGGARVALLEARMSGELAELVRRRGGTPICAPAVAEERTDGRGDVAALLDGLAAAQDPAIVFTTGVGVVSLLLDADALERRGEALALLSRATLVCRGPKPAAALAREGLRAAIQAEEPYTEAELLAALAPAPLEGRAVAVVHHGERSATLVDALRARGARLHELTLYAWRLPADLAPLRAMVETLARAEVEAVLFTSQIQARHLLGVAEEMGRAAAVRAALRERIVVASVGPTCTRVLRSLGIPPAVEPERPKMGALVTALTDHLAARVGEAPVEVS